MRQLLIAVTLFCFTSLAFAASPVGTWTTIDDKTQKPRSVIRISEYKGVLSGRILKVYKQPGDTGYCRKCPGHFKDKRVEGLTFLWGMKSTGSHEWKGGKILDPKNGKIYKCKMTLSKDGNRLDVRGYVGMSLFGRTQTWRRR